MNQPMQHPAEERLPGAVRTNADHTVMLGLILIQAVAVTVTTLFSLPTTVIPGGAVPDAAVVAGTTAGPGNAMLTGSATAGAPMVPGHLKALVIVGAVFAAGGAALWYRRKKEHPRTIVVMTVVHALLAVLLLHGTGTTSAGYASILLGLGVVAWYHTPSSVIIAATIGVANVLIHTLLAGAGIVTVISNVFWVVVAGSLLALAARHGRDRLNLAAQSQVQQEQRYQHAQALLGRTLEYLGTGSRLAVTTKHADTIVERMKASLENLQSTETVVSDANGELGRAAKETEGHMSSLSDHVHSQVGHVTQSSAAVEEMVTNIQSVNRIVQRQMETIETVDRDLSRSQEDVRLLTSTVDRLAGAGEQIDQMVSVIANVAAQTQLLAMNAAIEAAHAGDAGRGFSVVAAEIRKLSEKTGSEVNHIRTHMETISTAIDEARGAVERTGASNEATSHGFAAVREAFTGIASANDELAHGGNEVLQAIASLQEIAHSVQDVSGDTTATQREVVDAAHMLDHARRTLSHVTGEITEAVTGLDEAVGQANEIAALLEEQLATVSAGELPRETPRETPSVHRADETATIGATPTTNGSTSAPHATPAPHAQTPSTTAPPITDRRRHR